MYVETAIKDLSGARFLLTQFEIPPRVALFAAKVAASLGMTSLVNPAPAVYDTELDYSGVSILIPNYIEAKIMAKIALNEEIAIEQLLKELQKHTGVKTIIITLGEKGIAVLDGNEMWEELSPQMQVVDASGAGDQFCAALAVALKDGMPLKEACNWAVQAASISITRRGTIPAFVRKNLDI